MRKKYSGNAEKIKQSSAKCFGDRCMRQARRIFNNGVSTSYSYYVAGAAIFLLLIVILISKLSGSSIHETENSLALSTSTATSTNDKNIPGIGLTKKEIGKDGTLTKTSLKYSYFVLSKDGPVNNDALKAGVPVSLIKPLNNVLGDSVGKTTFSKGDKISIIYNDSSKIIKRKSVAKNLRDIKLLATEYMHEGQKKIYRTVGFTDDSGSMVYYTPDGTAVKPSFLRYPLKFKYISSPFAIKRYSAFTGTYYGHTGVDLVADKGTPVRSSSNGVIAFSGYKGNYGNLIVVRNKKYSTFYAHLSKFSQGIKYGSRVKQGQVIGYVGMTGMATGPHLHYEFRVNDTPYDPVHVKLPAVDVIDQIKKPQFFAKAKSLIELIAMENQHYLAKAAIREPIQTLFASNGSTMSKAFTVTISENSTFKESANDGSVL